MLLKTWGKHEHMSTKGEKQGSSGSIEHWMVCKVLKRKEYYLSSYPWLSAFSLSLDLVVVFRIEVQSTEQASRRCQAACAVSRIRSGPRTLLRPWSYGRRGGGLPRSVDGPRLSSSRVHSCTADTWLARWFSLRPLRNPSRTLRSRSLTAKDAKKFRKGRKGLDLAPRTA